MAPGLRRIAPWGALLVLVIVVAALTGADAALAHHPGAHPNDPAPGEISAPAPASDESGNGAVAGIVLGLLVVSGVALAALRQVGR